MWAAPGSCAYDRVSETSRRERPPQHGASGVSARRQTALSRVTQEEPEVPMGPTHTLFHFSG